MRLGKYLGGGRRRRGRRRPWIPATAATRPASARVGCLLALPAAAVSLIRGGRAGRRRTSWGRNRRKRIGMRNRDADAARRTPDPDA